jgi:FAD-dependent urate hydroxylase
VRVAVVGLGTAGATLACLLAEQRPDVELVVLEQAADPQPVGAGIWLQHLGQQVLDRLGLLAPLRERSREVDHVDVRTWTGRPLLDLRYADVPGSVPALGVHRGTLFTLLHDEVRRRGVRVETGVAVTGVRPTGGGMAVETAADDHGTFDLVVGADGSRSPVRRAAGLALRDRGYAFGALWAVVDDPDGLAGGRLFQSLRGTREYLGVLPTGLGRASVFWSTPLAEAATTVAGGLDLWRARARPLAGELAPLLDRVDRLLPAGYRDVVVRAPYRLADERSGVALLGDAAHAMSPQLGVGTSLALADAWTLARALRSARSLEDALREHERARRTHVRWYQWWTRLVMPVFQSGLTPLAGPRDLLAGPVSRVPWVRAQAVTTLTGDRTSPWSRWTLDAGQLSRASGDERR